VFPNHLSGGVEVEGFTPPGGSCGGGRSGDSISRGKSENTRCVGVSRTRGVVTHTTVVVWVVKMLVDVSLQCGLGRGKGSNEVISK